MPRHVGKKAKRKPKPRKEKKGDVKNMPLPAGARKKSTRRRKR